MNWGGWADTKWLAKAGENEWLAFSCNKKILRVPQERDTIIREKVGIVFLTNGEENLPNVLRLLLIKWDTFQSLWDNTQRPFARFLSPTGRLTTKYKDLQLSW